MRRDLRARSWVRMLEGGSPREESKTKGRGLGRTDKRERREGRTVTLQNIVKCIKFQWGHW